MKKNIGKSDKIVRYILGVAIIVAGIALKSWWGLVGLIPLLTAVINWCPLYVPFGIKTTGKE